ncbi:MAG: hypothetical protein LKJ83_07530 [Eubacteriaceae bacterium]|nr:hypothetical protein [Eubacteriaceae bacterium]
MRVRRTLLCIAAVLLCSFVLASCGRSMESVKDDYYAPREDTVVIAYDPAKVEPGSITDWDSLLSADDSILMSWDESMEYALVAIAETQGGSIYDLDPAFAFLCSINDLRQLHVGDIQAEPIVITDKASMKHLPGYSYVIPQNGHVIISGKNELAAFHELTRSSISQIRRKVLFRGYPLLAADGMERMLMFAIFVLLFVVWAASMFLRIADVRMRREAVWIMGLLIFWMLAAFHKDIITGEAAKRMMWYLYYVPALLMPVLGLSIALQINGTEPSLRKKIISSVYTMSCAFIIIILTNDLHQQIFRLTLTNGRWISGYTYGFLYFVIAGWILVITVITIAVMMKNAALKNNGGIRRAVPPAAALACLVFYEVLNALGVEYAKILNISLVTCLMTALLLEILIETRLIPSNRKYEKLFAAANIDMTICDCSDRIVYRSGGRSPDSSPASRMDIRGGYVVLRRDNTAVRKMRINLQMKNRELIRKQELLEKQEHVKEELFRLEMTNRLNDEVDEAIGTQLEKIKKYAESLGQGDKDAQTLLYIKYLIGYCKRKANIVLSSRRTGMLDIKQFGIIINETFSDLETSSVAGSAFVEGEKLIDASCANKIYDDLFDAARKLVYQGTSADVFIKIISRGDRAALKMILSYQGENEPATISREYEKERKEK